MTEIKINKRIYKRLNKEKKFRMRLCLVNQDFYYEYKSERSHSNW